MNLDDPRHPWARLTAGARRAAADRDTAAPYGFATRIAALAHGRKSTSLVARFALRAVGLAGLLALVSVAANLSTLRVVVGGAEEELEADDPVVLLLGD
ncbi:MAG: hypothetical protein EXS38_08810 [Opitutus sp.]|nr:hypothetical protein [Opitutus sp.]